MTMSEADRTIEALSLIQPDRSIVENAEILANHVLQSLASTHKVCVSMAGVRGVSSSYFNLLLRRLVNAFDVDVVQDRVMFRFDSPVQEQVFRRSLEAIKKAA